MTKKLTDEVLDVDPDAATSLLRPVRMSRRPNRRPKAVARSRKTRRKAASSPGGIHQRANKRMSW
jgi:hypothetical protein